ncbi:MAG: hypothetical protein WBH99_03765, partial [Azovibrio sp.]|uniref:hypothetical protein n=1 Tax=Azovibrio sp. TaxID=1872673 RepID=UPI003C73026E
VGVVELPLHRIVLAFLETGVNARQARSRHVSSLYIGTDTSLERASTGSPRNSRKTTSFFRPADPRFTSAAAPGSPPVALRAPSADPGATSSTCDPFSMTPLLFQTRFNLKFVSRKTGAGAKSVLRYDSSR